MAPVLPQSLVPAVVQAILNVPMGPYNFQQTLGAGLVRPQTRYTVDCLAGCPALVDIFKAPLKPEDLLHVGPVQIVIQVAAGCQDPFLDAPMPFVQGGG